MYISRDWSVVFYAGIPLVRGTISKLKLITKYSRFQTLYYRLSTPISYCNILELHILLCVNQDFSHATVLKELPFEFCISCKISLLWWYHVKFLVYSWCILIHWEKKRILWFIMELVTVSKACQLTHCALQPQAVTQINVNLDSNRILVTFIQGKFQKRYPSQQSLKFTWKLRINIFHSNLPCLNEIRWLPVFSLELYLSFISYIATSMGH